MLGVLTDNPHDPFSFYDLALIANLSYRCSHLHGRLLLSMHRASLFYDLFYRSKDLVYWTNTLYPPQVSFGFVVVDQWGRLFVVNNKPFSYNEFFVVISLV